MPDSSQNKSKRNLTDLAQAFIVAVYPLFTLPVYLNHASTKEKKLISFFTGLFSTSRKKPRPSEVWNFWSKDNH
jgi:hypothetical protein